MRLYKLRRCLAIFFASLILFLTPAGDYLDTQHIQKVEATGVGAAAAGIMSVVPGGQAVVIGLLAGMGIGIAWQNRDKIAETAKGIYDDIKEKFSSWAEEEAQEMVDSGEAETLEEAIIQTESYQSIRDLETLDEEYPAGTVETGDTVVISNANDRVSRLSRHVYRYMQDTYAYNTPVFGKVSYSSNWSYNSYANSFFNDCSSKFGYYLICKTANVNQYLALDLRLFSDGSYYVFANAYDNHVWICRYVNGLCTWAKNQYFYSTSSTKVYNVRLTVNGDWSYSQMASLSAGAVTGSSAGFITNCPIYSINYDGFSTSTLSDVMSSATLLTPGIFSDSSSTIIHNPSMIVSSAPYQNVESISFTNADIYGAAEQAVADAVEKNPDISEVEKQAVIVGSVAEKLEVTEVPKIEIVNPDPGGDDDNKNDDEINNIPYVPPVGLPEGVEIGDAAQQVIDQSVTNTNGLISGLQSILDGILNLPSKIASAFSSFFSTLWGWLQSILTAIKAIPGFLTDGFASVGEWIMDIPVTLESQLANVQGWIMDIPIPDTAEITQPIIDTIDDAISVDTDVVQETIAAEQTEVWNLPFFGQAQSLFDSFHFSDTVYYPKIKITTPDIIRPYYKQPEIILLDFEDYKDYCLWARLLCRAILWLALIWHIVDLATPKLRIT